MHPHNKNYYKSLMEDRESIILADKLDFKEAFVGEHLSDKCERITSCMNFISSLVFDTKKIKLATGTLNLTGFKQLLMSFYSIGSSGTAGKLQMTPNGGSATVLYPVSSGTSSQAQYTLVVHDLGSGLFTAPTRVGMARNVTAVNGEGPGGIGINKGLTASTTTITFNYDGTQTFNVGQILIYGIK